MRNIILNTAGESGNFSQGMEDETTINPMIKANKGFGIVSVWQGGSLYIQEKFSRHFARSGKIIRFSVIL